MMWRCRDFNNDMCSFWGHPRATMMVAKVSSKTRNQATRSISRTRECGCSSRPGPNIVGVPSQMAHRVLRRPGPASLGGPPSLSLSLSHQCRHAVEQFGRPPVCLPDAMHMPESHPLDRQSAPSMIISHRHRLRHRGPANLLLLQGI